MGVQDARHTPRKKGARWLPTVVSTAASVLFLESITSREIAKQNM